MSYVRYTEIACNGRGCDRAYTWSGTAGQVRARSAKYDGWLVNQPGGTDFCSTVCRDNPEED